MLSMKPYIDEQLKDVRVSNKLAHDIMHNTVYSTSDTRRSAVHSSGFRRKTIAVAVALCLVFAFSATAFATNLFGVRDMVIGSYEATDPITGEDVGGELVGLQGYPDSPEYKATAEWLAFTAGYDTDGALLAQVGNDPTGLDARFDQYSAYTQDMADALDAIVAKYNLSLHTTFDIIYDLDLLGKGTLLGDNHTFGSGYYYEDGSLHFDSTYFCNGLSVDYQFGFYARGTFSETYLNVGNSNDYTEWTHVVPDGRTVTLSLSSGKALLFTETDTGFVSVNILGGTVSNYLDESCSVDAAWLEAFADSFDYATLDA